MGKLCTVVAPQLDKSWARREDNKASPTSEVQRQNIVALKGAFEYAIAEIASGRAEAGIVIERNPLTDLNEAYSQTWGLAYPALMLACQKVNDPHVDEMEKYDDVIQSGIRYSKPLNIQHFLDRGQPEIQRHGSESEMLIFSAMGPHYPDEIGKHMRWIPGNQIYGLTPINAVNAVRKADDERDDLKPHVAVARHMALRCHRLYDNNIPFPLNLPEHDAPVFSFYSQWAQLKLERGILKEGADVLQVAKTMFIGFLEGREKRQMQELLEEKGYLNTDKRAAYDNKIPAGTAFILNAVQTIVEARRTGRGLRSVESAK